MSMKAGIFVKGLAAVGCAMIAAGCANMLGSSMSTSQVAARDLALSVADPASGTTQELTDLGGFLLGGGAVKGFDGFALYVMEGFAAGRFTWNPTANDYEATWTRSVMAGSVSGNATVTIDIAFFTSVDASGIGVQVTNPLAGLPSTIHSLSYRRELTGSFSNSVSGEQRQRTSASSFTVTGLSSGFTVNGSTTVSFTDVSADHRTVTGTLIESINNLSVSTALQADGSVLVSAAGTIMVDYSATITKADGTTVQIQKTATVTLTGQKVAHVDMDGTDVDVDVTTGAMEP